MLSDPQQDARDTEWVVLTRQRNWPAAANGLEVLSADFELRILSDSQRRILSRSQLIFCRPEASGRGRNGGVGEMGPTRSARFDVD